MPVVPRGRFVAWMPVEVFTSRVTVAFTGHGDAERRRLAHDGAVHEVDLRLPALVEVLEHGGPVGARLLRHLVHGGQRVRVGERDPPRPGHGHRLGHEVGHDRPRLLELEQPAVGLPVSAVSALMPTLITSLLHTRPATSASTCVSNPRRARAPAQRRELPVPAVGHADVRRSLPRVADAARAEERGALRRDPGGGPLGSEMLPDDRLVAQAVLEGEHDGVPARRRARTARQASSVAVDFTKMTSTSEPSTDRGIGAGAAGAAVTTLPRRRLLDGSPSRGFSTCSR